jgi:hypothetical protein
VVTSGGQVRQPPRTTEKGRALGDDPTAAAPLADGQRELLDLHIR